MHGVAAYACYGKGCAWVGLWHLLWPRIHWWAFLAVGGLMAVAALLRALFFPGGK